jgi:hypothetical protein
MVISTVGAGRVSGVSGGGGGIGGLNPTILSSDGSIRELINISTPGAEARVSFSHVSGNLLSYNFVADGTPKGSPARRQQFEQLLLPLLRLDHVSPSDRRRVVDQLCAQNPELSAARDRFMNADAGAPISATVPPMPALA